MKNLVLIGMPGCGKSSVGRLLARKLDLPMVDTDHLVEMEALQTVPAIFAAEGEAAFRQREHAAVLRAASLRGVIIATGGGVVLREDNMTALARTGILFFRDRDLSAILGEDHGGRPLVGSNKDRLLELYTQRISLYRKYAQYTISHTETAAQASEAIAALYLKEVTP